MKIGSIHTVGAIAQFFRQLTPNDMPVGGTAIGRALVSSKRLIERARSRLGTGPGRRDCEECGEPIPEARRSAVPGVRLCIACQSAQDEEAGHAGYNRRGSKDSQLR